MKLTNKEASEWLIAIKRNYIHGGDEDYDERRKLALDMGAESLENQKTGHWIIDINDKDYCFCQFCRHKFDIDYLKMVWGTYEFPPYCPNCGAELKGE